MASRCWSSTYAPTHTHTSRAASNSAEGATWQLRCHRLKVTEIDTMFTALVLLSPLLDGHKPSTPFNSPSRSLHRTDRGWLVRLLQGSSTGIPLRELGRIAVRPTWSASRLYRVMRWICQPERGAIEGGWERLNGQGVVRGPPVGAESSGS